MWLEEYRLDGLRWDATTYIRNVDGNDDDPATDMADGWRLLPADQRRDRRGASRGRSHRRGPANNEWSPSTGGRGGAGFDTQWDAGFVHPVREALTAVADEERNMQRARVPRSTTATTATPCSGSSTPSRTTRSPSQRQAASHRGIAPGDAGDSGRKKRSTLGAALVFTVARHPDDLPGPGVPGGRLLRTTTIRSTGRKPRRPSRASCTSTAT